MSNVREVTYEKADDGSLISRTHADNSGDGPYQRAKVGTHRSLAHAQKHLGSAFSKKSKAKKSGRIKASKPTHR